MTSFPEQKWEIPEFEVNEFSPKKHCYCVCVFVINEGERLGRQLKEMMNISNTIDIVVADGGSDDGSIDSELLTRLKVNTLLVKKGVGKLGTQMRMAFAWALRRGYDGVVTVDGNGKDGTWAISRFVSKLNEGFDHIQGSRFMAGGHHERTPLYRLMAVKMLHIPLIRWASGFRYTDTTNGFRAYSARLLKNPDVSVFRNIFTGYELHYYLAIEAPKRDFKCIEVPVTRSYPETGKTPSKISPIKGNVEVLCKLLLVLLGRYSSRGHRN